MNARRVCRALAAALVASAWATSLSAACPRASARLTFTPDPAAKCGDEQSLRDAVSARLGYDPFDSKANKALSIAIVRERKGVRATMELRDATGQILGTRDLSSTSCTELAAALGLAVSVAIDRLAQAAAQPAADPPEEAESAREDEKLVP